MIKKPRFKIIDFQPDNYKDLCHHWSEKSCNETFDADTIDADIIDGFIVDADIIDGFIVDADIIDAVIVDAAIIDAVIVDAAIIDAVIVDAAIIYAVIVDAAIIDAVIVDADIIDALKEPLVNRPHKSTWRLLLYIYIKKQEIRISCVWPAKRLDRLDWNLLWTLRGGRGVL